MGWNWCHDRQRDAEELRDALSRHRIPLSSRPKLLDINKINSEYMESELVISDNHTGNLV